MRDTAITPWHRHETGEHVLDFTEEAVVLWARDTNGCVREVGRAALEAPDFSQQIDALRIEALVEDPSRRPVTLWLPAVQILERKYVLSSRSRGPALAEATRRLQAETGYLAEELSVDLSIGKPGEYSTIVATLCQTIREAREYAERWGFSVGPVSTRVAADRFGSATAEFGLPASRVFSTGRKVAAAAAVSAIILCGGFAGLKIYEASKPIIHAITIQKMPGHVPLPVFDTDVRVKVARNSAPVAPPVHPRSMPIRRFVNNQSTDVAVAGLTGFAPAFLSTPPGELVQPTDDVALNIGAAPHAAVHIRPGRLGRIVARVEGTTILNVKRAIDQIRLNSRALAKAAPSDQGPTAETAASALSARPAKVVLASTEPATAQITPELQRKSRRRAVANVLESNLDVGTASLVPLSRSDAQPEESQAESNTAIDPSVVSVPAPRPQTVVVEVEPVTPAPALEPVAKATPPSPEQEPAPLLAAASPSESVPVNEVQSEPDPEERFAALTSPRPSKRPAGLVAAEPRLPKKAKSKPISTGRTSTSVGRAASERGLELSETNLIGVIEANSGRRALVRLPDGDFRKVSRGDDVNGWRVSSIERAAMRLTRKGQNRTLLLVSR